MPCRDLNIGRVVIQNNNRYLMRIGCCIQFIFKLMMASTFCHIRRAVSSDAQWIVSIYNHVQAALTASGSLQQLTKPSLDEIYTSIRDEYIFILEGANTNLIIGAVTISVFNPDKGHGSPGWDIEPWGKMWYLHSLAIEPTLQRQGLGAVFLKEAL